MAALTAIPALCQGCGERGPLPLGLPPWCQCEGVPGPFIAPPGFVARFTFEDADASAFREEARLASHAERQARDRLSERLVRTGNGWRELPRSSPKRRMLERGYLAAVRNLEALQTRCEHPERSLFAHGFCSVCNAHVECDLAHRAYLVRQIGVRATNRLAV